VTAVEFLAVEHARRTRNFLAPVTGTNDFHRWKAELLFTSLGSTNVRARKKPEKRRANRGEATENRGERVRH
jgi:hypothetical protein